MDLFDLFALRLNRLFLGDFDRFDLLDVVLLNRLFGGFVG
jgi:hypothetical protein